MVFRPLHEMTGNWFWWGSQNTKEDYKALFQLMFNHFKSKNVNNIIWCWSPDKTLDWGYYPGISFFHYYRSTESQQLHHHLFSITKFILFRRCLCWCNRNGCVRARLGELLHNWHAHFRALRNDYLCCCSWKSCCLDWNRRTWRKCIFNFLIFASHFFFINSLTKCSPLSTILHSGPQKSWILLRQVLKPEELPGS